MRPLSPAVLRLLEEVSEVADPLPGGISQRMLEVMYKSEILWKSSLPSQMAVFKCAADIVVKAMQNVDDDTEYTTLQYLEHHKPTIPASRPLGYVQMSGITLIFQTYKPSMTLAAVWSQLESSQKASIRDQLNVIMSDLRSITFPDGSALGGVAGEGCKDIRRHLRRSEKPIWSASGFEDFLSSSPHSGGQVFVDLLCQLYPHQPEKMKIVFTHGDLRPDNITVDMDEHNQWVVTGLLDWEYSGFYPEYCEAFECTNCITPYEEDDWYLFLLDCISLKRYAHLWLLDRVRETRVV
ncbi:hypothetical protein MPDQ_002886 [Monascus purpureus]|uniref:Aminoglycoside phosphotransferase domain-containing protein n=1 Tax=Monascus purpureus TaxID=5098 RepID=A0A507QP08_MONPU|nr:hypothetical protein MPDQ_002886 [Monascus purpureus]